WRVVGADRGAGTAAYARPAVAQGSWSVPPADAGLERRGCTNVTFLEAGEVVAAPPAAAA
ncbi:MAG TPA: hypothetical protein VM266_07360, partial [Solirubrobacteraceae bacterium]|nr:hypothetical protein [Solirubrobacteraceae bacterium]